MERQGQGLLPCWLAGLWFPGTWAEGVDSREKEVGFLSSKGSSGISQFSEKLLRREEGRSRLKQKKKSQEAFVSIYLFL